jgi:predicted nucleotidyltransferase
VLYRAVPRLWRYCQCVAEEDLIKTIAGRLAEATPAQSQIVLFGCRALREQHSDSDFDVLVIEPAVEDPIRESVRLRRLLRGLGVAIDILVVTQDEAARRGAVPGTVVERALREGRVLVEA